jgi:N-methylhydantoinase A
MTDATARHRVVGVDVGGTFTDIVTLDDRTGSVRIAKVASTRGREADGFMNGLDASETPLASIATIVHGTTVGTNALLERRGARCGLITTAGFRDVLEMRRRDRPATWGLRGAFTPVIPRDLRLEAGGRIDAAGREIDALDRAGVARAARALIDKGCEAIVIAFINAHANPAHEQAALAIVRELWPNQHVAASHEILPEIREFERFSTTALNGYLQPVVATYLDRLERDLRSRDFAGELLVVQSNGGVMTAADARARPVRTALSGPAAGVIACARLARAAGYPDIVTCDMGGTSFDISLIAGGETSVASQTSIDFGLVVRSPMIEILTIGAGGGSIARVDESGLLDIGPESAGSIPGPVCYGRGNDRPTVTDANALLGRIDPERPIGALARFDMDAAARAIEIHVGGKLGLDAVSAAEAMIRVANARMAGALRLISIERGHDPRQFAMLPFGGGGALHAGALIREVGFKCALIPRYPGVLSALGCVMADMRIDFVRTVNLQTQALDVLALGATIAGLVDEGRRRLGESGVAFTGMREIVEFDMCYLGQTHTIAAPLPAGAAPDRASIERAFEERYRAAFGRLLAGLAMRVLNLRVAVIGLRPEFDLAALAPRASGDDARKGVRRVRFAGEWRETAIHDRDRLAIGADIAGPAIVEQSDTTIVIEPGQSARVDHLGTLILRSA